VEIPIGIPNHAIPPSRKALVLVSGREATALCQYAWSLKTVPLHVSLEPTMDKNRKGETHEITDDIENPKDEARL